MDKLEVELPNIVVAPRTDPIYNCHSYLTKVPVGAIEPFIQAFSKPGDTIADIFAGSGMTGLAALKSGRSAELSDISVLGKHIADGYCINVSDDDIRTAADETIQKAKSAFGDLYITHRHEDNTPIELNRTIWSFTYTCPKCSYDLVYFDQVADGSPTPKVCPSCGGPFARRTWPRKSDVPVAVVLTGSDGRLTEQAISNFDKENIRKAEKDARLKNIPSLPISKEREMFSRSGLGKTGITETKNFFSARNSLALLELWNAINNLSNEAIKKKLLFAFTAILARASRRYQWSAKRPLNAQNQTYYIAPVYFEWNVFDLFSRKVEAVIRAKHCLFGDTPLFTGKGQSNVSYSLNSASDLEHLKDESIDYIFTDPPFGSNIYYSDMNLFQEAWLGAETEYSSEAVIHTTGERKRKSGERYESILRKAFEEAYRVLKPGKFISIVFGNSNGKVWSMVQRAIRESGFHDSPTHVAILDKGQRSVKGLNSGSEKVVTVDLILTLQKPLSPEAPQECHILTEEELTLFITDNMEKCLCQDTPTPSHVYGCLLREAIHKNYALDNLHLSDVLFQLKARGYAVDPKTGRLFLKKSQQKTEALKSSQVSYSALSSPMQSL